MSDIKLIENEINNYMNESVKLTERKLRMSSETLEIGNNILCELDNQKTKLISINNKTQNINTNLNEANNILHKIKHWFTFRKKEKIL